MAKRREILDGNKIEKYIKMGYGSGEGKDYKPWVEIQDFASLGRVSRIFGWKANRIHHLLSDLEKNYFYLLEWSDIVVDIREQFPLLERPMAMDIAQRKGIKYPVYKGTEVPYILTTDFMITVRTDSGKLRNIARTVKPSDFLEKRRTIEKFEIERCYWEKKGVDWGIVTEHEINSAIAGNIEWLHLCYRYEDLGFDDERYFNELAHILQDRLYKFDIPLNTLVSNLDIEYNTGTGTFLKILKHLIAVKAVKVDMTQRIDLNRCIKEIISAEKMSDSKEMKC